MDSDVNTKKQSSTPELMNSDENPGTHISNVKNGTTNDVATLSNAVSNGKPTTEFSGILNLLQKIDQTNASYEEADENAPNANSLAQMGIRLQNSLGILNTAENNHLSNPLKDIKENPLKDTRQNPLKDTSTFSGKNENSAKLLVENGKTIVSNTGPLLRVMTNEEKQSLRVTPAELVSW